MAKTASTLYGTTSDTGSVPNARHAGPTWSSDGKLILSESFNDFRPVPNQAAFETELRVLLDNEEFVETWRIWDCDARSWASIDLTLYRFEMFDLVVRQEGNSACAWRGAVNTQSRIAASQQPEENAQRCWQWLRVVR